MRMLFACGGLSVGLFVIAGYFAALNYANGTGTGEILWKMGFEGDFTLMRGGEPDPNTADWFFAAAPADVRATAVDAFAEGAGDDRARLGGS